MIGNISKSKGFKGDTGLQGPQGPQGIQGVKGDTPSIVFKYDSETGNLYYKSDGILVDKEYIDSNNIVTKDQLDSILAETPTVRKVTITLLASAWVEDDGDYSQVVSIAGITPYSQIDLQPNKEQLDIFREKDITFWAENENGVPIVYCMGHKPTNDYVMQATVMEVTIDEED